jgi:hypothetical protein
MRYPFESPEAKLLNKQVWRLLTIFSLLIPPDFRDYLPRCARGLHGACQGQRTVRDVPWLSGSPHSRCIALLMSCRSARARCSTTCGVSHRRQCGTGPRSRRRLPSTASTTRCLLLQCPPQAQLRSALCLSVSLSLSLCLSLMDMQILGNNESFEPFTSNVYARRVLSGEFQVASCPLSLQPLMCC